MKKIISLISAVAMMASMVVTASAESKMKVTTTCTPITGEQAGELGSWTTGLSFDFYRIDVSISDFGTLNYNEDDDLNPYGRKLTALDIKLSTNDLANIKTQRTKPVSSSIITDVANNMSFNTSTGDLQATYGAGTIAAAYPTALPTVSATSIDNVATFVVAVLTDKTVKFDITAIAQITNWPEGSGALTEEPIIYSTDGTITLAPASITLGEAASQGPTVTEGATANGITTYTFENVEDNSVMKGQKILMTETAKTGSTITEKTRFKVTYEGQSPRYFGSDIWEKLAQGAGSISVGSVKFGLIVDEDEDASKFTFEIVEV